MITQVVREGCPSADPRRPRRRGMSRGARKTGNRILTRAMSEASGQQAEASHLVPYPQQSKWLSQMGFIWGTSSARSPHRAPLGHIHRGSAGGLGQGTAGSRFKSTACAANPTHLEVHFAIFPYHPAPQRRIFFPPASEIYAEGA